MTPAPDRSIEQRMDALVRANEIRVKRANVKRDLRAGTVSIHDLLLYPPDFLASAKVFDLLMATPKYGRVKACKVLRLARISASKTVGGLSPRQRTELMSMLRRPTSPANVPSRAPRGSASGTQHMMALAAANGAREERSEIKRQIASGERTVADVLREHARPVHPMPVADLVMAQHRWGAVRTQRLLRAVPVFETTPVGSMTRRQRDELIRRLDWCS